MAERTPEEQAVTRGLHPSTPLEERVAELEARVEGLEHLLAQMRSEEWPPIAPETARAVAEEQHGVTSEVGRG